MVRYGEEDEFEELQLRKIMINRPSDGMRRHQAIKVEQQLKSFSGVWGGLQIHIPSTQREKPPLHHILQKLI